MRTSFFEFGERQYRALYHGDFGGEIEINESRDGEGWKRMQVAAAQDIQNLLQIGMELGRKKALSDALSCLEELGGL